MQTQWYRCKNALEHYQTEAFGVILTTEPSTQGLICYSENELPTQIDGISTPMSDCELRLTKTLAKADGWEAQTAYRRPSAPAGDFGRANSTQHNETWRNFCCVYSNWLTLLGDCLPVLYSLGLYFTSFAPSLFRNISFSLFQRMIRPWPPRLDWPRVEPVIHWELQRPLKSGEHLCLVLANNPIKDRVWTRPLYFRTYRKYF